MQGPVNLRALNQPMTDSNPKGRFTPRAEMYRKYRPSYPEAAIHYLIHTLGIRPGARIADIGSGTGLSAEPFLKRGYGVIGVEPNAEMRRAAEDHLKQYAGFTSIDGSAEDTTLAPQSIDFVIAATAYHWFDPEPTRREFRRILKPGGQVVLLWNTRHQESAGMKAYEALLDRYADGRQERHGWETIPPDTRAIALFAPRLPMVNSFPYEQRFDWPGLKGRLLSASYAPQRGDARYKPMIDRLRRIFKRHAEDGVFRFEYRTRIYHGPL